MLISYEIFQAIKVMIYLAIQSVTATICVRHRSIGRHISAFRIHLYETSVNCIIEVLCIGVHCRNLRLLYVTEHRRNQDSSEDTDDCDYDDELYECEALNLVCFHTLKL